MTGLDSNVLIQLAYAAHPKHSATVLALNAEIEAGHKILIAPQIISEFVHVVTDPRRFATPLTMVESVEFAEEVLANPDATLVVPSEQSVTLALRWLREFNLGRNRVLDTQLAAIYHTVGSVRLLTSDPVDFQIFKVFELISP